MREVRHVILAAVFALTGVGVIAAAQPRVSDEQVRGLLSRIDTGTDSVCAGLDRAVDPSRINGGLTKAEVNQSLKDFKQATDRLHTGVNDRQIGTVNVEDVLRARVFHRSLHDGELTRCFGPARLARSAAKFGCAGACV